MNSANRKTTHTPKDPSRSLVVQSNSLVEARYKLPLLAQQALRKLFSQIKPDTEYIDKEYYQINIAEFGRQIGRKETTSLYREMKSAAKVLRRMPIIVRKDDGDFLETSWIQSFWYREKAGRIDFLFSKSLNPFLTELRKRFTQYRLDNVCRLGSQYSIRVYELMMQYASIGSRTIALDELRAILGIREGEYADYRQFRPNTLDVAHREVNAKTDLRYSWEPVKEGRRVIAIRFYDIITSEPAPAHTATPPAFKPEPKLHLPQDIIDLIPEGHQNDKGLIDTLSFHLRASGQKFVRDALCYANRRELKNYPAYVTVLLRNGFTEEPEPPQTKAPIDLPPEIQKRTWITIDRKEFMISGFIDNLVSLDGKDGAKNSITKSLLAKFLGNGRALLQK
jgi:hypothetical protein